MIGWPGSEENYTAMKILARIHAASHSIVAEALDGLLLATVHVYLPLISPVTFRVWRYSAVVGFSNTVSFPSATVIQSLVQVTVVAGPPVGDTGQGELRTGSINVHIQCNTTRYGHISYEAHLCFTAIKMLNLNLVHLHTIPHTLPFDSAECDEHQWLQCHNDKCQLVR